MSFIEPFVESIQSLPCGLKRHLTLLRELDIKVSDLTNSADKKCEDYLNNIEDLSSEEKYDQYNQITSLYDKAINYSGEKRHLAAQTYNLVDKQIQQLDVELAKLSKEFGAKQEAAKDSVVKKKGSNKNKLSDKNEIKKENEFKAFDFAQTVLLVKPDALNMEIDPNEPLYCSCNQVSFGEMIGCDEADCQFEWFHFQCVGLKNKPKGKWYCPDCTKKKKNKQ